MAKHPNTALNTRVRLALILRMAMALVSLTYCSLVFAAGFDEIRPDGIDISADYQEHYQNWLGMSEREKTQYLKDSLLAFQGDNKLDPMPRVLNGKEYDEVLKKGVEQRAKAIIAFLKDHYSGEKEYLDAGIISASTLQRIIERSGEEDYSDLLKKQKISFIYGPDIIRDEYGQWRVIEDNPGFVGGLGDLVLAQKLYMEHFPNDQGNYSYRDAEKFYDEMARMYKKRAAAHGGNVVLYMTPPYSDKEDKRLSRLLTERGIKVVTTYSQEQFSVEKNGVYTINNKTGEKEKVGLIIFNGEHSWLEPNFDANYKRLLKFSGDNEQTASKYINKAKNVKGLTEAILQKKVATNYTPGIDFIGDKEFYLYVEDFIRFYLNEEPVIKNISTESFASKQTGQLREKLLAEVIQNKDKYVIKVVDGRGGDGVWVGPKVSAKKIAQIAKLIRKSPESFIVQKYTPLSTLNDLIVDLRLLTIVSDDKVYVTETPWGRGLPATGDGKVNLSAKGREITVLVADPKNNTCKKLISN